ncbi:leucyl/phenylalanyl-tRNA--protein transferase [Granulosicoccaceae sp. 1_MG-2023]|nr:leucyl/phenylalanyl-tRNA--protein transferase [Granulosicoccaceae sp. 1_MG-2023]
MPIPFLASDDETTPFPPPDQALAEPNGLLMAGGALSPARLMLAYRNAVFPWFEEGDPVLWWSPDPRCILWPGELKVRRSLAKTLRKGHLRVTTDQCFTEVMRQCAAPRRDSNGTWITDSMICAYSALADAGLARSVEVWADDQLVGGLYGVVVGRVFVGESMFSRVSDASKVALVYLAREMGYALIDCQLSTPHLESMGATTVARAQYLKLLRRYGADTAD